MFMVTRSVLLAVEPVLLILQRISLLFKGTNEHFLTDRKPFVKIFHNQLQTDV